MRVLHYAHDAEIERPLRRLVSALLQVPVLAQPFEQPVLPNGCLALVDFDMKEPNEHDPFAVCVNGYSATVKRVKRLANGFELIPNSYDPTYIPTVFDYNKHDTEEITITGQVVWATMPFDYEI